MAEDDVCQVRPESQPQGLGRGIPRTQSEKQKVRQAKLKSVSQADIKTTVKVPLTPKHFS